jgi:histidine triad (HIT) family protein
MSCVFCAIVAGTAPASIIYRDELVVAFMTIHPTAPGECTVIPLEHVDHFTDVEDATAERIMRVAQSIGRRMRMVFQPQRVGMVVHGYGVAHAHLIIVPQHGPYDITSGRFARIANGEVVFTTEHIQTPDRHVLDEHARSLSSQIPPPNAGCC